MISNYSNLIQQYKIGFDSRLQFKGDPQTYWVKNVSPNQREVFVTINGAQTFRKSLKNLEKVDGKSILKESTKLVDILYQIKNGKL